MIYLKSPEELAIIKQNGEILGKGERFCSTKCKTKYFNDTKKIKTNCSLCGVEYDTYINKEGVYHCRKCAAKLRSEKGWITLRCEYCDKEFKRQNVS